MRLFNAAMVENFLTRFNIPDDVPIESKMVSNAIRSAQSQRESQNFEIRKNVLKYDDVINRQREVIYSERRRVLAGEDLHEQIRHMINDAVGGYVDAATSDGYAEEWDLDQLWTALRTLYPISLTVEGLEDEVGDRSGISAEFLREEAIADAQAAYDRREEELGSEVMRELERRVVLSVLDRKWREHLYEMDYLQEGIGLRAMAQRDPLVEYQREGFQLFNAMMEGIKEESVGFLFNLDVQVEAPAAEGSEVEEDPAQAAPRAVRMAKPAPPQEEQAAVPAAFSRSSDGHPKVVAKGLGAPKRPAQLQYTAPTVDGDAGDGSHVHTQTSGDEYADVPRNAMCPCGSGKKFKRCHGDPRVRAES
jgi:preprotein translocase subunit SecA